MIDIEDVRTLRLGPDQALVVKADGFISSETKARIQAALESSAPMLKGRLLIIDKSITLAVIDAAA